MTEKEKNAFKMTNFFAVTTIKITYDSEQLLR